MSPRFNSFKIFRKKIFLLPFIFSSFNESIFFSLMQKRTISFIITFLVLSLQFKEPLTQVKRMREGLHDFFTLSSVD